MAISIGDFFRQCESRGALPLRDHLNLTNFVDHQSAKYMRNRVVAALKTERYERFANTIILNDGSRASVFENRPVAETTAMIPSRPASLALNALDNLLTQNEFLLPNVTNDLCDARQALTKLSRSGQIAAVKGIVALNADRLVLRGALSAAELRAADLAEQLAETRRDKAYLQQVSLLNQGKNDGGN